MKTNLLISLLFILCLSFSCNKNDDEPEPTGNTEQGLVFKIKENNGNAVDGATIGICNSISEALSNTFIESKVSDSEGKAVFTLISKGDYFYKVTSSFGEKTEQFSYDEDNQTITVQVN